MNGEHLGSLMGFVTTLELAVLGGVPLVTAILFLRRQKRIGKQDEPFTKTIKHFMILTVIIMFLAFLGSMGRGDF